MNDIKYSQQQVFDSLLKQGYPEERAKFLAESIGDIAKQDSNIMPNTIEGGAYLAANELANKYLPKTGRMAGAGKFMLPLMAANLAGVGYNKVSGNNFYDDASLSQIGGDVLGQFAGGAAASKLMSGASKALAKRAGSTAAGRLTGSALGSFLGPMGTLAGSVIGGYLVPKLFSSESDKLVDPKAGIDSSTVAALGAAATLASPLGRPARKLISENVGKANEFLGRPATWLGPKPVEYAEEGMEKMRRFMDPLTQNPVIKDTTDAYRRTRDRGYAGNYAKRVARVMRGEPIKSEGMDLNYQDTLTNLQALGSGVEGLGESLVNQYYKNRAA